MEDTVPTCSEDTEPADTISADIKITPPGLRDVRSPPEGLVLRAMEPSDWPGIAALTERPKVRWGTLRVPFTSREQWRNKMENPSDNQKAIVAVFDGTIIASAGIRYGTDRRRHAGEIGICVHDDHTAAASARC